MPSRRRIDFAKIRRELAAGPKNEDDGRPWFAARLFRPPLQREVRAIWPDGIISFATVTDTGWTNDLWAARRIARQEAPAGWKPYDGIGGCPNWGDTRPRLPDPLQHGIQIT